LDIVKKLSVGTKWDGPVEGYRYYMGLDVARLGVDESAIVILAVPEYLEGDERATADVCYWAVKGKQTLTKVFRWASEVAERWRAEAIGVDITGMGAGVGDLLAENFGNKVVQIEMVGNMRNDVYINLQRLIEDELLRLPRDEKFVSQFGNFWIEYDKLGRPRVVKGARGRDDLVDALAYACWAWRGGRRARVAVFEELLRMGL
jgi:phage FluMu gp28-like protein